jgi:hypothetical protein
MKIFSGWQELDTVNGRIFAGSRGLSVQERTVPAPTQTLDNPATLLFN